MNELKLNFEPAAIEAIRTIFREELDRRAEELYKKPIMYSRKQACNMLGLSLPTLDTYIRDGRLKASKTGRRIFISEAAIKEFINVTSLGSLANDRF